MQQSVRERTTEATATWLARTMFFAAIVSLLGALVHGDRILPILADVLGVLGIPSFPSLLFVALLTVLSGALRRRLRAAHTVACALMATEVAANIFVLVLVVTEELGDDDGSARVPALLANYFEARYSLPGAAFAAAVSAATLALVIAARPAFPAKLAHGSRRAALGVLVGGLLLSYLVTLALTFTFPGRLRGPVEIAVWALRSTFGVSLPRPLDLLLNGHSGPQWIYSFAGIMSATVLILALMAFWRAGRGDELMTEPEELEVRRLLLTYGEDDSLGYFATRRDKSVIAAPDRRAVVTSRVVGPVSMASADPIGDRESWPAAVHAWLEDCRRHSLYPAVLAASIDGAAVYEAAGLRTLNIGDEAIIHVDRFTLKGREMRAVRQAVTRVSGAGYTLQVRRHADLTTEELTQVAQLAEKWRGEETERGFSMALNRIGDPVDGRCVLVTAHDAAGEVRGLLSFVPWGTRGLSLDLMRRDRNAENGLNEFMVAKLVEASAEIGIRRISLNFAVFRAVFFEADRVGAGPVTRMVDSVLSFASKFYQLETLYRSNDKYRPDWVPRILCYDPTLTAVRAGIAVGTAEGFLPQIGPKFLSGPTVPDEQDQRDPEFVVRLLAEEERLLHREAPAPRLSEQQRVRRRKLTAMEAAGMPGYPPSVPRTASLAEVRGHLNGLAPDSSTDTVVSVTGRVRGVRDYGGVTFVDLHEDRATLQVIAERGRTPDDVRAFWRESIDMGDLVSVTGEMVTSHTGELSVLLQDWAMAGKCLSPVPKPRVRLGDETRARSRSLDLMTDDGAVDLLYRRSRAVAAMRAAFTDRGFTEVETPMLQSVHGGAAARPFTTHINAYDMDLYLRIAPELYLKRLAVGGMGRIFEINRNFRNEGADATHNPEFTSLEAYEAYGDYTTMRTLTREVILGAAIAVNGRPIAVRPDGSGGTREVDLTAEWPVITVHEAVSRAVGTSVTPDSEVEELEALCKQWHVAAPRGASAGKLVMELYEGLVEKQTEFPTFYCDFPIEVSPLARRHRRDPRLTEQWDLVGFGAELGTAYTELTDPIDQRERLTQQSMAAAAGDPEAMELDESFLDALSYAMPPTGGLGIGVDRIIMLLAGVNIRATLAFPFIKPQDR
ncbi:Lysine--tRNA ligase OS=Tsukamurella paurometabola (strain ATCC 8368 / DSM / CCUG 35730 / CIP 100753 / JCM 10117 / KCTC 9821 / NBRC 16120 / NCIMB 702349/ NCTC 13040) OX=521096 GN=lysS PE=3 SV=1 [Tsukamurella paurometabola]|uniref:Lysine--tRNA ligase n=1 Tax=Tsukamurella paurometabola (strain ATCC 8368 / DSM 20162 / CCUG 35730 / CIP 100753 / JCM 10117 / KCTC 9821 / NBRC 16120 / NCIMB 702349 / NCTC 13040) TaxID=521096 RepID=D5UM75_TSUPD|nr:bifunctional lysylphosphatidylglycerol synthetase/lysine--tRNA ligase LysX [Tsukamurella paurometabola]ADG78355.1 lysyl-tRNA synthetase [Tsukamurella paurometabola DSM 20162]SUP31325.1 Lysylphosphatidylglycerol biosynthesis bifunctional protein LysX [Tsukamurella paurometabola]